MDDKERLEQRKKRERARKRKNAGKAFLIIISIIILAAAAFLITLKICDPSFKFESLLPKDKVQQVVSFVKEDVLKQTTTTTAPPTKPTTTRPPNYDYVQFSDFAFDTSLQGNQVGNLLNNTKGAVTYSAAYIYYSIENDGIYRFEPNNESNAKVAVGGKSYNCLNVLGDYIYYIDTESNTLKRSKNIGGGETDIASDISFAYLYSDRIYYIGSDNTVGYININDLNKTMLYSANTNKELSFVGISLSRVFFASHDITTDKWEYITVNINDFNDCQFFRDDTTGDEIKNMSLEGGFFYYYQKQSNGSFNLIRQKFGSDKTVTLLESCSLTDYPVVYENRLYYSELNSGIIRAKELNMNSMEKKLMVSMFDADSSQSVGVGYGYQYVFLFGKPTSGSAPQYRGSCIYTSASVQNTITFSKGKWSY